MVIEWGMSDKLGFVKYSPLDRNEFGFGEKAYSDETAHDIDDEILRLANEAYADARRLLEENWERVVAVAEALLKHESLDADDVAKLCRGEELDKPTLSGLLADEVPPTPPVTQARPVNPPPEPDFPGGSLPQPG